MMETIYMDMTEGCDEALMAQAGEILRRGGLVAFPTETVYGLGGNALDPEASAKIYSAKGRPSDNPLIVHIASFDALPAIVSSMPAEAEKLAKAFWPGPLTMILPRGERVPLETTGGLDTVAVRMPDNDLALALIRAGGGYVAGPSANTSGRPSPTKASHVMEDLGGKIDAVIDGGSTGIGVESTIVDLTEDVPVVLRPGYINMEMLRKVIGEVRMDKGLTSDDPSVRPKAPGMKYRHYAPKADMVIVEGKRENVIRTINRLAAEDIRRGRRVAVLTTDEGAGAYPMGLVVSVGTRKDEITIARHLYDSLRYFDKAGVDSVYSEAFDTPQVGGAVMNRLLKAAGHRVIMADEE